MGSVAHLTLLLWNVTVQGTGAHVLAKGTGQLITVALGLAEDDGASQSAVAAHQVSCHCGPLTPMAGQCHVLHACGCLHAHSRLS